MAIKQIIKYLPAPICGSTDIGKEKQKEYDAHDSAIIILRKYEKIEQIFDDWHNGKINNFICCLNIDEVLNNGDDD